MTQADYMRFHSNFLRRYLEIAPAALAIERSYECEILAAQRFERPILDVGCGDGVFAAVLCADRIDTGIDFDPVEIARARAYDRYDELIACSGAAIPKPDGSYRTIFSNSVLEHIPDITAVLREQFRLLAPGGRFYVTIPTDRWERASLPARMLHALGLDDPAWHYAQFYNRFWHHYHALPEEGWSELFGDVGFTVVEQRIYVPPNLTTLLDVLTPLGAPAIIAKKLLGRWFAVPQLRRLFAPAIHAAVSLPVRACARQTGGNLVFFALTK